MVSMEALAKATLLFLPLFFNLSVASLVGDLIFGHDSSTQNPDYETSYGGGWELATHNSGVSAMHMVLLNNNKAIIFDATVFGPSQVQLAPGNCRPDPKNTKTKEDCWAHAVEYDTDTGFIRPLKILTDTWCSSGSVSANGILVQWRVERWRKKQSDTSLPVTRALEGVPHRTLRSKMVHDRRIAGEDTQKLKGYSRAKRYATQQILPDGSFVVIGGRRQFSYEFVPKPGQSNTKSFALPFLRETTDEVENNLYPFVHLSTDGNLFILANNRSILLDYNADKIIREFPVLPGGSRNYPASGMSVLLPLNLEDTNSNTIPAEVLVCGGSPSISAKLSATGTFLPALDDCARITITDPDPTWRIETMPSARVMGDMLLLPNAQILMINGAKQGTSGWGFAREPNLEPLLYEPNKPENMRFTTLNPTTIPRMYHSTSAVLPDGRILVAGSNTNNGYNYTDVMYPTELRVEKFWPPYLDPLLKLHQPAILPNDVPQTIKYGENFGMPFLLATVGLDITDLQVTMYAPPFTTHGYSMNQRLIILKTKDLEHVGLSTYEIVVFAPPTAVIAPPGYYLFFLVHRGVPSKGIWIKIQ